MSRASQIRRRKFPQIETVAHILSECYGDHSHGNKLNPLNELLFIICSVQTNEVLYQSTYASLKARFATFRELADAAEDEIASVIAHGGLSRQKAQNIYVILSRLEADFGAPTLSPLRRMGDSECENYLISLPGVGKKTARCVMMYSLGRDVFPVDSDCWRICRRLGWVRATRPDRSCSPRDMDSGIAYTSISYHTGGLAVFRCQNYATPAPFVGTVGREAGSLLRILRSIPAEIHYESDLK